MQKHANLVDLVTKLPTNILLQNLASIQKRTSPIERILVCLVEEHRPIKFAYLAEKSEKGSISNLSTKVPVGGSLRRPNAESAPMGAVDPARPGRRDGGFAPAKTYNRNVVLLGTGGKRDACCHSEI